MRSGRRDPAANQARRSGRPPRACVPGRGSGEKEPHAIYPGTKIDIYPSTKASFTQALKPHFPGKKPRFTPAPKSGIIHSVQSHTRSGSNQPQNCKRGNNHEQYKKKARPHSSSVDIGGGIAGRIRLRRKRNSRKHRRAGRDQHRRSRH